MEEPQILAPCGSGRRSFGDSKSPEFEFWMVRNPAFPQPNLLSADQLFSDGILLPLHHLTLSNDPPPPTPTPIPTPTPPPPREAASDRLPEPESSASDLSAAPALTSSKRWRDIFKKNDKKANGDDHGVKEKDNSGKDRRKEKNKKKNGVGVSSSAELNINIWPFARSRSAGNGGTRPRAAAVAARKVSSAPCSRSNSRGESKSRKVPSSPGRAGVHVGRSSPVWQVRRGGGGAEKVVKKEVGNEGRRRVPVAGGSKAKVISLNVPMCIGYRQHFSCRSVDSSAGVVVGGSGGASGEGVRGSNLFNIRGLFSKKVY